MKPVGNYDKVIVNYIDALRSYIKILYPDENYEFICDHYMDSFDGIKFDGGSIYVRRSSWNPFSYMFVYGGDRWIEGVDDCVKVAIEEKLIARTEYLKTKHGKLWQMYREEENFKKQIKLDEMKQLRWLCK